MKDPSLVSAYFPMSSLAPARRVGVLLQRRPAASLCWIWWTLSAAQSTVCVMGQYSDSNVVCKNIFPSWGLLNSLLFNCKTSFQVKINHEITKNPHFPKTCIKIVTLFTQPFRSPLPIFVGIFTHGTVVYSSTLTQLSDQVDCNDTAAVALLLLLRIARSSCSYI